MTSLPLPTAEGRRGIPETSPAASGPPGGGSVRDFFWPCVCRWLSSQVLARPHACHVGTNATKAAPGRSGHSKHGTERMKSRPGPAWGNSACSKDQPSDNALKALPDSAVPGLGRSRRAPSCATPGWCAAGADGHPAVPPQAGEHPLPGSTLFPDSPTRTDGRA